MSTRAINLTPTATPITRLANLLLRKISFRRAQHRGVKILSRGERAFKIVIGGRLIRRTLVIKKL